jgi:hypothetical protein
MKKSTNQIEYPKTKKKKKSNITEQYHISCDKLEDSSKTDTPMAVTKQNSSSKTERQ